MGVRAGHPKYRAAAFALAAVLCGAAPGCEAATAQEGDPVRNADPPAHRNRLAGESSPYLLQHAGNPVDWYPWGDEAFERARREDKPIFLSIGYSTCHWCHVMERESFESEEVARFLNEHFVAIKVDREERPDIDQVYMAVVQAMTGQGGWPLSVFLTPDGRPFFGGTYFPPESRAGHPGFLPLLQRIHEMWTTRRALLVEQGSQVVDALRSASEGTPPREGLPGPDVIEEYVRVHDTRFDDVYGGFEVAPKFPRSHGLDLLLRHYQATGARHDLEMVETTLDAMRRGGIFDHLGGGFHRYSTDRRWLVPHFEKMLYDQALLARTYAYAFQITGREDHARTVRETLDYVLRDLRHPDGGFFTAEDADSEGEEGRFYTFTPAEVASVLDPEAADLFDHAYGVSEGGDLDGRSVLHIERPPADVARATGLSPAEAEVRLAAARESLLAARNRRPRPLRDDKVLADWNGLAISAFAVAGMALPEPRYVAAAEAAARFVIDRLRDPDGSLLHAWRDGAARVRGLLDDYAFLAAGLLDLYQATIDARWLAEARRLADAMALRFRGVDGAFRLAPADGERLIAETVDAYDGAVPSGNSVAAIVLARLARLTGDARYRDLAAGVLRRFGNEIVRAPIAFPAMLWALADLQAGGAELVLAGDPADPAFARMASAFRRRFFPAAVLLRADPGTAAEAPFVQDLPPRDGRPTAYLCRDRACELPTTDPALLEARLERLAAPGGGS